MKINNKQQLTNYDDCYQRTWGRNYSIQPIRDMRYRFVNKALRELAGYFPVKRALDVGCGIGEVTKFIYTLWKDIKVTGIDVSREAIDLAKKNNPDIDFLVSDIESLEVEKDYDLITAIDVIEHIKNDKIALARMSYLLKDNGILVMSLPHSMRYWTKSDETGGHYRRYSKKETMEKLREVGFSIVNIRSYGFPFPVLYLYLKNWLNKCQICNEDELVKKPKSITRVAVLLMKYLFTTCEFDINLGLHLLVIAKKLPKNNIVNC